MEYKDELASFGRCRRKSSAHYMHLLSSEHPACKSVSRPRKNKSEPVEGAKE